MRAPKEIGPLQVWVREIPPEGLTRAFDLPAEFLTAHLDGTEADPATSRAHADVSFHKSGDEVFSHGQLVGGLTVPCGRCLAPATVALDGAFDVTFIPVGQAPKDAGVVDEAALDQADVKTYAEDVIDLEETLREELLLALPIAPLCQENCKGLCAQCGADLNQGDCECPKGPTDVRWAALKDLKV